MAIHETDREDLLGQASQFSRRWLFQLPPDSFADYPLRALDNTAVDEIFVGLRSDHGFSIFLGQRFVLHFNAIGHLRRAYWADRRLTSQAGHLVELSRASKGGRVVFQREELEPERERTLLTAFQAVCRWLLGQLDHPGLKTLGVYPTGDGQIQSHIRMRLGNVASSEVVLADRPNAG